MKRLKSIPLWTAVLALIYLVVKNWFGVDIPAWADISSQILAILAIIFGVANNPTDKSSF
ncbi:MAG: holin [Bacillota bacterium]|nr:holin [Bacillota bacterium]